jgi:hypothetical protein
MITASVTFRVVEPILAALSPEDRWQAMRQLSDHSLLLDRNFIIVGLVSIAILLALLFVIHYGRQWTSLRKRKVNFSEFGKENGLSTHELKILNVIATKAGLQNIDAIFTMPAAFDKGVNAILLETGTILDQSGRSRFTSDLTSLRSKLGFNLQPAQKSAIAKDNNVSSRQIPVGKTVELTRRKNACERINAQVIHNDELELTVKMLVEIKPVPGEVWNLHYNMGSSIWEFESPVLRAVENEWIFGHSDNVRFRSRRRFIRVDFNGRAYIAKFPFNHGKSSNPPEFVEGNVRELGGPGLLIQAPLNVRAGERVLAMVELPDGNMVQDIAEVRHVQTLNTDYAISLEFIVLGENEVDYLIAATNSALIMAKNKETEPVGAKA